MRPGACSSAGDAGDVNDDGIADLIIGAPGAYPNNQAFVLFGRDARVLFASQGPLGKADRDRLVALLRGQIDATPGS